MQAFETFITAAKSGGGEDLNGDMAELGILQIQRSNVPVFPFPFSSSQSKQPIQTRAALGFLLSEKGDFFREFLLDEVIQRSSFTPMSFWLICHPTYRHLDLSQPLGNFTCTIKIFRTASLIGDATKLSRPI